MTRNIDQYSGPEDEVDITTIIRQCTNRWHVTESIGARELCPECPVRIRLKDGDVVNATMRTERSVHITHTVVTIRICISCELPHTMQEAVKRLNAVSAYPPEVERQHQNAAYGRWGANTLRSGPVPPLDTDSGGTVMDRNKQLP